MFLSLAIAAALASGGLPAARVEVLEGRAEIATASGVVRAAGAEPAFTIAGPAYVEIPVRTRARIDWPSSASLELLGPATLEWAPASAGSQTLRLRVFTCERMMFETRRAPLEIELPGGWRCELRRGAGSVRGRYDGAFELYLDAGDPGSLSARTSERHVWPALTVLPGARLTLVPGRREPLAQQGDLRRVIDLHARDERAAWERAPTCRPWQARVWPWRAGS